MKELNGYIQNMESILEQHVAEKEKFVSNGGIDRLGSDSFKMMLEFSIKTAKTYRERCQNDNEKNKG